MNREFRHWDLRGSNKLSMKNQPVDLEALKQRLTKYGLKQLTLRR